MEFTGEHLWIGKTGHLFVLCAFVTALMARIAYGLATAKKNEEEKLRWLRFARLSFYLQSFFVIAVFACIFYICSNHYIEYLYAYKHTSKELEFKYLLACIWEDQSGSFLLWSIWHCAIGIWLTRKAGQWEAPVMAIISTAQVFLAMMVMGVYILGTKFGNSPFVLTRHEIQAPIFSQPDYLTLIGDGVGLNVLLRNYWMVIHPPILFLGFASTVVPFAFACAGIITRQYGQWVKPALPYTLFSACVLGVGIMMGGKWAYESLSFGGYWAWDPVENASLVPWLILIAGLHTMVVYKATGHSLRASVLFAILSFLFILYSTFLTRTGVLGDTSVHAFTEAGSAMNILILSFLLFFCLSSLVLFIVRLKHIPAIAKEEEISSREFWMFIGSVVFFLSGLFISAKTSVPVINSVFGTQLAPPEDVEFSYNKVMVLVAIITGLLSAIVQYLKYKNTARSFWLKKIALPTAIAMGLLAVFLFVYPIKYYTQGAGFLVAIYIALFATLYSVVANGAYIWYGLKGKFKSAGGAVAHAGFMLMIAGMLISAGNKKVISEEKYKQFALPTAIDPLTKKQDKPAENVNLIKQLPNRLGEYEVTYLKDSSGHEKTRRFYKLAFLKKDSASQQPTESFFLYPDVYMMKDNNMSSNPDIRSYLTHDIFTYVTYALNPEKNEDTATFKISEIEIGDTLFYSKGYAILRNVLKNPAQNKQNLQLTGPAVAADIEVVTKEGQRYAAQPLLMVVGNNDIAFADDTLYAQNLYFKFAGVGSDGKKIKVGIKESNSAIDFVSVKAYLFPYINLVWIGLILMAVGFVISINQRAKLNALQAGLLLAFTAISLFYMFLIAGN
jgi:cytochrome c-type biogenesis protein CcmF